MIVTTTNHIAGQSIASYLGVVRGIVVRSPSIAQGFTGGLQSIFGGNIDAFTQVCEEARREAFERMVAHAQQLGAHAVIGMRYDATEFAAQSTEVLAYGTAVRFRDSIPQQAIQQQGAGEQPAQKPNDPLYIR